MLDKHVLILSQRYDLSTCYVLDWLLMEDVLYDKIDEYSEITIKNLEIDNNGNTIGSFVIKDSYSALERIINLNTITSFWYRRGNIKRSFKKIKDLQTVNMLSKEWNRIKEILLNLNIQKLGDYYFETEINKFEMLRYAKQAGFFIPKSYITENIDFIKEKLQIHKILVLKPLKFKTINLVDNSMGNKIQILHLDSFDKIKKPNFPVFIQEYIKKEYELRIVVINKKIYAMCIFSQISEKAKYDFREDYDGIRMVPYNLNQKEKLIIKKFMNLINQDSGSIDLIRSTTGKLFFLEINPTGQFDFVSKNCNYNIEYQLANQIIKNEEKKKK